MGIDQTNNTEISHEEMLEELIINTIDQAINKSLRIDISFKDELFSMWNSFNGQQDVRLCHHHYIPHKRHDNTSEGSISKGKYLIIREVHQISKEEDIGKHGAILGNFNIYSFSSSDISIDIRVDRITIRLSYITLRIYPNAPIKKFTQPTCTFNTIMKILYKMDLKKKDIASLRDYMSGYLYFEDKFCPDCGGADIECDAYYNPNTKELKVNQELARCNSEECGAVDFTPVSSLDICKDLTQESNDNESKN